MKIILLDQNYQNNLLRISSVMRNVAQSFDHSINQFFPCTHMHQEAFTVEIKMNELSRSSSITIAGRADVTEEGSVDFQNGL